MHDYDLVPCEGVYQPREDSLLMAETIVSKIPYGSRVLDMGTGTGILALVASEQAKQVVAVDANPEAVRCAQENAELNDVENVEVIESDMFEKVQGRFDVILFNAPYLPVEEDGMEAKAWSGGPSGRRQIERFMKQVGEYLAPEGKIYLVISSLTGLPETQEVIRGHGFSSKIANQENLAWEVLYVLEIIQKGSH